MTSNKGLKTSDGPQPSAGTEGSEESDVRTADNVCESVDRAVGLVDIVQAWDLNQPPHVVRV